MEETPSRESRNNLQKVSKSVGTTALGEIASKRNMSRGQRCE